MFYLLTFRSLCYDIVLTVASRLAVWKRMQAYPQFTVGYGYSITDSDE